MPRPEAMQTATVQGMREQDILPLLDTMNLLENQHVVNGSTSLFGGMRAPGAPAGGPLWTIQLPIYGPEKVVRAQMEYAKEKFARIPDARFNEGELFRTPLDAATLNRVRKVSFGVPDLSTFGMLGRNPANPAPPGGHIGFSPIIPRTGEAVLEYLRFYTENLADRVRGRHAALPGPGVHDQLGPLAGGDDHVPHRARQGDEREDARRLREMGAPGCRARLGRISRAGRHSRTCARRPIPSTTIRSRDCARRSRMRWIPTASCRRAATACGRST